MNNIFVGNLSFEAKKEDVRKLFEAFGVVVGVAIVEKKKGKSRGFAFVCMPNEEERAAAMAALNGKAFMGRELLVNPLIPKVKSEFKSKKYSRHGERRSRSQEAGPSEAFKPASNKRPYRADDRKGAKPYKSYAKASAWGQTKDDRGVKRPYRGKDQETEGKPARRDDRDIEYGRKNKPSEKPAYKKYGGYPKAGPKKEGPMKKFFKSAHPPKSSSKF